MTDDPAAGRAPSIDDDRGHDDRTHANLRAMGALLNAEADGNSTPALFQTLHAAVAHDQAIILQEDADALLCTASAPDALTGGRWPAEGLLEAALHGQVVHLGYGRDSATRAQLPPDLIAPVEAALLLPVAIQGRRAVLVLRRAGPGDFGASELAFARQCAVLALAALAARNGHKLEAEIARLRRMLDETRQGEGATPDLVKEIVEALPVGVAVQDEDGRFVLVNAVAAAKLETAAEVLIGASPADFLSAEEAAQRRQWEIDLVRSGQAAVAEESVASQTGERTWLSSHKPASIVGRNFLLSASVDISERKEAENRLARRAYFDDLTGLPNRVLIQERVEDALGRKDGGRFALAFLDLDNFKHINDYFSHAVGDALLIKVAERIQKNLRDSDMIARVSGDEFLLLLDPVAGEDQVRGMVEQLLGDMKQPFHTDGFEVFTSASIGVSIHPEHGTSYEVLRRNADSAMYRAKSGMMGAAIYDTVMGEKITARMELEQRLRLAIRDGKFCCAFQPKVDIHSQEVVGFETLVRWRDEAGEIHPPSSFIGLAIELGLIDPITHFVLAESVNSIARLDQAFGADTTISINVAAKQASDVNFMQSLADALRQSRYAERIIIELTEEAFVAKNQFQMQVFPMLRDLGVRVSIDDFGTGYSSLSVLADITADEVKVDRSFITNIHQRPRSQSVLRTIESLCHALGMTVLAEGVETFEELAYLRTASRIRYAQGYYFSKPFFLDDLKDTRRLAADIRPADATRPQGTRRSAFSSREPGEAWGGRG